MTRVFSIKNLLFLMVSLAIFSANASAQQSNFKEAVEKHLNAVENRDLTNFVDTITTTDRLLVIMPDGSQLTSTKAVIDFHIEWFKDKDWIWNPAIDRIIEGENQSTALVKYSYQNNADDTKRYYWLVLVFQIENGTWRLIHDQNTAIGD